VVTADLAAPDPSVLESDVHGADVVLSGLGRVEVFGPDSAINRHFTTGPVAGLLVDDSGNGWVHVRAPDGNIYEFTQDPGVARPH
jgi:hypothetical protein